MIYVMIQKSILTSFFYVYTSWFLETNWTPKRVKSKNNLKTTLSEKKAYHLFLHHLHLNKCILILIHGANLHQIDSASLLNLSFQYNHFLENRFKSFFIFFKPSYFLSTYFGISCFLIRLIFYRHCYWFCWCFQYLKIKHDTNLIHWWTKNISIDKIFCQFKKKEEEIEPLNYMEVEKII